MEAPFIVKQVIRIEATFPEKLGRRVLPKFGNGFEKEIPIMYHVPLRRIHYPTSVEGGTLFDVCAEVGFNAAIGVNDEEVNEDAQRDDNSRPDRQQATFHFKVMHRGVLRIRVQLTLSAIASFFKNPSEPTSASSQVMYVIPKPEIPPASHHPMS
jgi:hypothetical protein